jgi:CHRD domain
MLGKVLTAFVLSIGLQANVAAATVNLGGTLTTGAEIPAPDLTGVTGPSPSGFVLAFLDTVSGDFNWFVTFNNLTTASIAAHFHGAANATQTAAPQIDIGNEGSPVNAGEAVDVFVTSLGLQNGLFSGKATLGAGQITDVLAGLWYVNVHSTKNTSGEIRAQLLPVGGITTVPLPAALWLMIPALGVLGLRRRA